MVTTRTIHSWINLEVPQGLRFLHSLLNIVPILAVATFVAGYRRPVGAGFAGDNNTPTVAYTPANETAQGPTCCETHMETLALDVVDISSDRCLFL